MALEQRSQAECPVMTTREAAELLCIDVFEIRRMVVAGDLWGKTIGGRFYLDRRQVKRKARER